MSKKRYYSVSPIEIADKTKLPLHIILKLFATNYALTNSFINLGKTPDLYR